MVDVVVVDYTTLFEQAMEVVATLKNVQSMQQKIKQDKVGPTIEQLVEQIKQGATQSGADVAVAQVELEDICSDISTLSK